MEQKRMGFAKRLKTLLSVFAVAIAAAASLVALPQGAVAAEYYDAPIKGVKDQPGFKWVGPNTETGEPGHYLIYNPVDGYEGSHESGIGWWYFALYSRTTDFDGYLIRLASDLSFKDYNFNRNGGDPNQLSVGSEDLPFSGTFDGCGHTISKLTNERSGLDIQMDNGFFGWTNGATIKNIGFKDCYIGGSYRDGLVAGYARDTFFLNITAENCTTSVIPANNVLNLITNAGISGGTIAGVANGCTLYNCEMRGGRVVTNATAGVAALGGQPLYMGGLVGFANDTVIEYSRVTDIMAENGTRTYAQVSGTYETAVSVANYSEVFVGGIVGGIQTEDTGTKIVDCYSTADVYGKAAIYFGVGLGLGITRAYCGGIVGIAWADGEGENLIERTSYAGKLHSYQYNQLLLGIPIIQEDAYMGGILSVGADNVKVNQAYFDRGASSTDKEIKAYQYWTTDTSGPTDGGNFGPRDNDYANRDFWESCDFDFAGGTLRDYDYPYTADVTESEWKEDHYNKWAMDYKRGIPVHSGSIKATMDFPGSGTVTIGTTTLSDNTNTEYPGWQTSNPYDFAVQGYTEDADAAIDLTYMFTTEKNLSWAADGRNQGFRFMGWYGNRDVSVNDIAENHSLFTTPNSTLNTESEGLLSEKYLIQDGEQALEPGSLTVTYPNKPDNPGEREYADNDLYVAHAQAQVLLHSLDGRLVDTKGAVSDETADDWYDYEATFTLPTSVPADGSPAGTFIGWTNVANANSDNKGYESISSIELANLKDSGQFWNAGDTFTVKEPTNLYPVYSQYNDIHVIYEGHGESLDTRDGYGTAVKATNDATGDLVLSVQPTADSPILDDTVRFLGWYEYVGEETDVAKADEDTDPANWLRVSRGAQAGEPQVGEDCYTFNVSKSGADLTEQHIYKARFEYRVDYWACGGPNDESEWQVYDSIWHTYNQEFTNIQGPVVDGRPFVHWATLENTGYIDYDSENTTGPYSCQDGCVEFSGPITASQLVFAHHASGDEAHVALMSDFPVLVSELTYNEGEYELVQFGWKYTLTAAFTDADDANFAGWTFERDDHLSGGYTHASSDNPMTFYRPRVSANRWVGWAHLQARVTFHDVVGADGPSDTTVYRKQLNPVFRNDNLVNYYKWYYAGNEQVSEFCSIDQAFSFDTSMARQGYIFLGWLDMSDPEVTSALSHIVNGQIDGSEAYLAKTPALVAPYLMTGKEVCTRPMDLYPVYTQFKVNTTTNIAEAGVDATTYNIPQDPAITDGNIDPSVGTVQVTFNDDTGATVNGANTEDVSYDAAYNGKVAVTVDNDQTIWKDSSQGSDSYTFVSLSVYEDDVLAQTIPASEFNLSNEGATQTSNAAILIAAGHSYEFVVNYSPVPVTVTYHMADSGGNATEVYSCEVGEVLPTPKGTPSFSGHDQSFVVGWTEGTAEGEPEDYGTEGLTILTPGRDTVTGTMHLWPVYRTGTFIVNSNIDSLANPDDHRGWNKTDDGQGAELWAQQTVEVNGDTYGFKGWTTQGDEGEIENASTTWSLYGDNKLFPDPAVTYTAVYKKAIQVRYHDTEGNVIYTRDVEEGSQETFITTQTVDVPKYDEDGKPVVDEDGSPVTVEQEQKLPIDTQAFANIAAFLNKENASADATSYQQFVTWQLVKSDGSTIRWGQTDDTDNFINQAVTTNAQYGHMDLYPVTVELTATDSDGDPYTDITAQLALDEQANKLNGASVTLLESYDQPWLKVHIDEVAYALDVDGESSETKGTKTPQSGVKVNLYGVGSSMDEPMASDETRSKEDSVSVPGSAEEVKLKEGDAIFTFAGFINIEKRTTDANAAGKTFTFTIASKKDSADVRKVTVKVGDEAEGGYYTGSVRLAVPFGDYTISEDTNWAWRYSVTLDKWGKDENGSYVWTNTNNNAEVNVTYTSEITAGNLDGATSSVRATNTRSNNKWSDGSDYKHNVFNESVEGGK